MQEAQRFDTGTRVHGEMAARFKACNKTSSNPPYHPILETALHFDLLLLILVREKEQKEARNTTYFIK